MKLAGVDLAWQSENKPSGICFGELSGQVIEVTDIYAAAYGIQGVLSKIIENSDVQGVAIDAPLIINNESGQRPCETEIGKMYGARGASCHTSNKILYPKAKSVDLSVSLEKEGFLHLEGTKWQIECYPHPAIIEIFGLDYRLLYKKGKVADRKIGQKRLANLIKGLSDSRVLSLQFGNIEIPNLNDDYIDSLKGLELKSNEDALDSMLCLYIAGLHQLGVKSTVFGEVDTGYIWVPQQRCI